MATKPDIPDIRQYSFSDEQKFKEALNTALEQIVKQIGAVKEPDALSNQIIQWYNDGATPIPKGYKLADGNNGTFNAGSGKVILIQKVG